MKIEATFDEGEIGGVSLASGFEDANRHVGRMLSDEFACRLVRSVIKDREDVFHRALGEGIVSWLVVPLDQCVGRLVEDITGHHLEWDAKRLDHFFCV